MLKQSDNKRRIAIIDLETSGLDHRKHEILQIAATRISFVPGKNWKKSLTEESKISFKVRPTNWDIDPFIVNLVKFDPYIWRQDGVDLPTALAALYPIVKDAYWVGSKPSFDQGFIYAAIEKLGWQPPILASHHPLDLPSAFAKDWFEDRISKIGQAPIMNLYLGTKQKHQAENDVIDLINLISLI